MEELNTCSFLCLPMSMENHVNTDISWYILGFVANSRHFHHSSLAETGSWQLGDYGLFVTVWILRHEHGGDLLKTLTGILQNGWLLTANHLANLWNQVMNPMFTPARNFWGFTSRPWRSNYPLYMELLNDSNARIYDPNMLPLMSESWVRSQVLKPSRRKKRQSQWSFESMMLLTHSLSASYMFRCFPTVGTGHHFANWMKTCLLTRFIYGLIIHPCDDSDSAFVKVYGFDIQVVSASWGTERAEVSSSEKMWCLRLDPKLTAYNQGNGCRAQTIWMYAKGVRGERRSVRGMNFPRFSHSKNKVLGTYTSYTSWAPKTWPRWGVDGEAAINHIDISFRLSTRTAEFSITQIHAMTGNRKEAWQRQREAIPMQCCVGFAGCLQCQAQHMPSFNPKQNRHERLNR